MSAFRAAVDAMFADPNIAVDAVYGEDEAAVAVRVVLHQPDRTGVFGEVRLAAATSLVDVRVSEVPAPVEGDVLTIAGERYAVQGAPGRDRERLTWTLEVRPAPEE